MLNFYPSIFYKINDFDLLKVKDITISIRINDFINSYKNIAFRPYVVKDGERPDTVSYRLYGAPKFDYVLLLLNDIRDVYNEWPMSYSILNEHIEMKYGSMSAAMSTDNGLYFNGKGHQISRVTWINSADPKKYFKTFYEYENELNVKKSFIRYIEYDKVLRFEVELREILARYNEVQEL